MKKIDYIVIAISLVCLAWLINDLAASYDRQREYEYLAWAG